MARGKRGGAKGKKQWFAVLRGHTPGVYASLDAAVDQTKGFTDHLMRGYKSEKAARSALAGSNIGHRSTNRDSGGSVSQPPSQKRRKISQTETGELRVVLNVKEPVKSAAGRVLVQRASRRTVVVVKKGPVARSKIQAVTTSRKGKKATKSPIVKVLLQPNGSGEASGSNRRKFAPPPVVGGDGSSGRCYIVYVGRVPGIYPSEQQARNQVEGVTGGRWERCYFREAQATFQRALDSGEVIQRDAKAARVPSGWGGVAWNGIGKKGRKKVVLMKPASAGGMEVDDGRGAGASTGASKVRGRNGKGSKAGASHAAAAARAPPRFSGPSSYGSYGGFQPPFASGGSSNWNLSRDAARDALAQGAPGPMGRSYGRGDRYAPQPARNVQLLTYGAASAVSRGVSMASDVYGSGARSYNESIASGRKRGREY